MCLPNRETDSIPIICNTIEPKSMELHSALVVEKERQNPVSSQGGRGYSITNYYCGPNASVHTMYRTSGVTSTLLGDSPLWVMPLSFR